MSKEIVEIAGEIHEERENSYCFYDGAKQVWLPKSQAEWDPDDKVMRMPEWLAEEKGLI